MNGFRRYVVFGAALTLMTMGLGSGPSVAQPRAHVYILRGLLNVFSLGMDTLAAKIESHRINVTIANHLAWGVLADEAADAHRAGTEGPIILIGHSLGADAAMNMAAYLGHKGVRVALVILFDATQVHAASGNVGAVLNLTKSIHIQRGPGFHGSLVNYDVRADRSIDHLNVDKSARLQALALRYVLNAVGARHHTAGAVPISR